MPLLSALLICVKLLNVVVVVAEKAANVACCVVVVVVEVGSSTVNAALELNVGLTRLHVNVYTPLVVPSVTMVPFEIVGAVPLADAGSPVMLHVGVAATGLPF